MCDPKDAATATVSSTTVKGFVSSYCDAAADLCPPPQTLVKAELGVGSSCGLVQCSNGTVGQLKVDFALDDGIELAIPLATTAVIFLVLGLLVCLLGAALSPRGAAVTSREAGACRLRLLQVAVDPGLLRRDGSRRTLGEYVCRRHTALSGFRGFRALCCSCGWDESTWRAAIGAIGLFVFQLSATLVLCVAFGMFDEIVNVGAKCSANTEEPLGSGQGALLRTKPWSFLLANSAVAVSKRLSSMAFEKREHFLRFANPTVREHPPLTYQPVAPATLLNFSVFLLALSISALVVASDARLLYSLLFFLVTFLVTNLVVECVQIALRYFVMTRMCIGRFSIEVGHGDDDTNTPKCAKPPTPPQKAKFDPVILNTNHGIEIIDISPIGASV